MRYIKKNNKFYKNTFDGIQLNKLKSYFMFVISIIIFCVNILFFVQECYNNFYLIFVVFLIINYIAYLFYLFGICILHYTKRLEKIFLDKNR